MNALQTQISNQFKKAFDDLLEKKLVEKDFEWVARLYVEIRERLCNLIPRRKDLHEKIREEMDATIFVQMLENDMFKIEQILNLINYVFGWFEKLQSPHRDDATEKRKQELYVFLRKPNCTLASFVPFFIKKMHIIIDEIDNDTKEIKKLLAQKK